MDLFEKLESKVKNCNNENSIFNTKDYVLMEDAKEILKQALTIPAVVGRSEQLKCFIDAEPKICHNPNKNYKDCKDCPYW